MIENNNKIETMITIQLLNGCFDLPIIFHSVIIQAF